MFGVDMKTDYTKLGDTELFAESRHVREKLERLPTHHAERLKLTWVLDDLTAEFDKRARSAWTNATCAARK